MSIATYVTSALAWNTEVTLASQSNVDLFGINVTGHSRVMSPQGNSLIRTPHKLGSRNLMVLIKRALKQHNLVKRIPLEINGSETTGIAFCWAKD